MSFAQKALDAAYKVFGQDASYVPLSGPSVPCRIIPDQQDDVSSFGSNQIRSDKNIFNVRALEITLPARGASLVHKSVVYTIKNVMPLDPERLEWQMECVIAS